MSLVSRAIGRRDKAWSLHELVSSPITDRQPLSVAEDLTTILRDIPADKFGALPSTNTGKLSPEWETVGIVARIASLSSLWSRPHDEVRNYLPNNDPYLLQTFRARWSLVKDKTSTTVIDFLELLNEQPLNV